jgi:hypothetical protein
VTPLCQRGRRRFEPGLLLQLASRSHRASGMRPGGPEQAPFARVVEVARHIHRLPEATPNYVNTSGRSGIHIMVPLHEQADHAAARSLAEVLAPVVRLG